MKRLLSILTFLYLFIFCASANYRFRHLSSQDGLPHQQVETMAQDRKGNIWIGTRNGLVRYDGDKNLYLAIAGARPKYHIFGHVHEEGLQRKAMLGSTTFLTVSYFEELRKLL